MNLFETAFLSNNDDLIQVEVNSITSCYSNAVASTVFVDDDNDIDNDEKLARDIQARST